MILPDSYWLTTYRYVWFDIALLLYCTAEPLYVRLTSSCDDDDDDDDDNSIRPILTDAAHSLLWLSVN